MEKYFEALRLSNRANLFQLLKGDAIVGLRRHFKTKAACEKSLQQFSKYESADTFFANFGLVPISLVLRSGLEVSVSYFSYSRELLARVNNSVLQLGIEGLFLNDYDLVHQGQGALSKCFNKHITGISILRKHQKDWGIVIDLEDQ